MVAPIPYLSLLATVASLVAAPNSVAIAAPAAPSAPANTVAPSISGTPKSGLTLSANPGTWTGAPAPTFTYQWRRCDSLGDNCVDIGGAVSINYSATSVDAGSTIRVVVTASNGTVDASATSDQVGPVTRSPSMQVQPSISGNPVAGDVLTAAPGTWSGYPAPTYSYQWRLCDASLGTCSNIVGATGTTYTLAVGDIGSAIRVGVTAANSAGSSFASSNQTAVVTAPPAAPPVNTADPTISGTTIIGQLLTASTGTWTGTPSPTYSHQWKRCDAAGANCFDIVNETASTYTLAAADSDKTIRVTVTASNASADVPATSAQTAIVTPPPSPPANVVAPTIGGVSQEGQILTASSGTWTGYPLPTLTYQWRRCDASGANCANIGSATNNMYTPVGGDVGSTIRVVVAGTNGSGNSATTTSQTAVVAPAPVAPSNTALPTISGITTFGQTLTTTTGTWSGVPAPTFTYQWERCDNSGANCVPIGGATGSTYVIISADQARTLRIAVTGTNATGSSTVSTAQTSLVLAPSGAPVMAPVATAAPTVTGAPRVGEVLSAQAGTWAAMPIATITLQWQRCVATNTNCVDIAGATSNTYTIPSSDLGALIRVVATATNIVASATASADASGPVLQGKIEATLSKVYATLPDSAIGNARADSVPADGSRFSRVRVELRDAVGNAIAGRAGDVVVTIDGDAIASPVHETSTPGVYDVEVRSTKVNVATISIAIDGITLSDRAKITFVRAVAELDVTLSASNEAPQIGDVVVFTVVVKNLGPNASTGVEVEHKLSDRVTYVSSEATRGQYDPATAMWTIGGLALGESAALKVTVKVTK
jgi:uncharacterized repeat protein (TIGR01451 family)